MLRCMTSFTFERWILRTSVAITCNNDVVCSMSWTPPFLTSLMISCIMSPIWTSVFFVEVDELEGWLWFFFSTLGEVSSNFIKLTHINNPWFFKVIFISLFIITFVVINVQIGKVRKHGSKTSTIRSIPCPTILNDIFFSEIGTCKKMATWCLHKFPHNTHSHVQQAYLVKGNGTLYVIFGCCWFHTIHAWLVSFKSSIPWATLMWRINVAFSTLVFAMRSITLFLMNPCFFISTMCM